MLKRNPYSSIEPESNPVKEMMEASDQYATLDVLNFGDQLLISLKRCNDQLRVHVEKEDWTSAQEEAANRHGLLEKLSQVLSKLDKNSQNERVLSLRRRIKWSLEDLRDDNDSYLLQIRETVASSQESIKTIKKGRRAIGLYRKPGLVRPRFLNKMG